MPNVCLDQQTGDTMNAGVRGLGWLSRVLGSKTPSSVRMKYIFFKT